MSQPRDPRTPAPEPHDGPVPAPKPTPKRAPEPEPSPPTRYRVLRGVSWRDGEREVEHDEGVYITKIPAAVAADLVAAGAIEEVTRGEE